MRGKKGKALWACTVALFAVSLASTVNADVKHKIRQGDTVSDIADRYHVSTRRILKANHLTDESILGLNRTLVIPGVEPAKKSHSRRSRHADKPTRTQRLKAHVRTAKHHAHPKVDVSEVQTPAQDAQDETAAQTPEDTGHSKKLIDSAVAMRGLRYRYGGTSRGGFDCSGFTRYVYSRYGISLPHSSSAQFSKGQPVSKDELQPGDLVFFHTHRSGISHVGIYIGGGRFVHASNVQRGVTVDSLSSSYYASRYRGARRVN